MSKKYEVPMTEKEINALLNLVAASDDEYMYDKAAINRACQKMTAALMVGALRQ